MTLVLALAVIVGTGAAGAAAARLVRLPGVVGVMVAGMCLGPLVLGRVAPGGYETLFGPHTHDPLTTIGTLGACLFLFVAGARHSAGRGDGTDTPNPARVVAALSIANALAALLLGAVVSLALPVLDVHLDLLQGAFLVLALTALAIPVMVRIIDERGLTGSGPARIAVAVAVTTDIAVWVVLAVLGQLSTGDGDGTLATRAAIAGGLVVLVLAGRRMLSRRRLPVHRPAVLVAVALACLAGGVAASLGVGLDPLIGSFGGGLMFAWVLRGAAAAVPVAPAALSRAGGHVMTMALTVFFASSAMVEPAIDDVARTLALAAALTVTAIAVRALAVASPALGPARSGLTRDERRTCFWLVCARGGTELALLRAGHDLGLIPPTLHTAAVLMTLLTTVLSAAFARPRAAAMPPAATRPARPAGAVVAD